MHAPKKDRGRKVSLAAAWTTRRRPSVVDQKPAHVYVELTALKV